MEMESVIDILNTFSDVLRAFPRIAQLFKRGNSSDREWKPDENDQQAAWEMYVEMSTRITTQPLPLEHGDEKTALESIYSLFPSTRDVLKKHGRHCKTFPILAIGILNHEVRPFTQKWHSRSLAGDLDQEVTCLEFRNELKSIQEVLREYMQVLAKMAGVEDFANLTDDEFSERREDVPR